MSQGKGRPFIKRPADQRRPAWHSTAPLHYTTVVSNGKKFAENNLTFVSCFDSCSDVRKFVLVIEKNPRLKAAGIPKLYAASDKWLVAMGRKTVEAASSTETGQLDAAKQEILDAVGAG